MNEGSYLADWRSILSSRAAQAIERFSKVDGVSSLILGGSLGGGEPWPLSDIDVIPIYEKSLENEANVRICELRLELLNDWEKEGWRTALDVGKLYLNTEMTEALAGSVHDDFEAYFEHELFYHIADKAYRGKPLVDTDGYGARLVQWLNRHRFQERVVALRKIRLKRRFTESMARLQASIRDGKPLEATYDLNEAVEYLRTYLLENWGHRDNSFARIGTRFESIALARGEAELIRQIDELKSLGEEGAIRRIGAAPEWIRERHRLSYMCRKMIGEHVSEQQDAKDVLRVFSRYEMRNLRDEPLESYPEWLGVVVSAEELHHKQRILQQLADEWLV